MIVWVYVDEDNLASENLFEALEENFSSTAVSKARGDEKKPKKSAKALRILEAKAVSICLASSKVPYEEFKRRVVEF